MTRSEALAEARRRWGANGRVWRKRTSASILSVYCVGRMVTQGRDRADYRLMEGRAYPTMTDLEPWESAFADADRREGGAK